MNRGIDYISLLEKKEELLAQLNEVESKLKAKTRKEDSESNFSPETNHRPEKNDGTNNILDDYAVLVTGENIQEESTDNQFNDFLDINLSKNLIGDSYINIGNNDKFNHEVLKTGKPVRTEGELHFRNKSYNIEFIKTPLLINGNVKKVLTLVKDISEKQKINRSIDLMMALIDTMDDFAIIKNLDQKILAANNAYITAAGKKDLDEIIGKTEFELFGDDNNIRKNQKEDYIAQKLKKGESIESEGQFTSNDGSVIDTLVKRFPVYDGNENLIATASIIRDITSLKNEHRKLARSEEKYRMLIENQGEGACIIDGYDRFIFANSAAENLFDVRRRGLIDRSIKEFFSEKDFENIKSEMDNVTKDSGTFEFEIKSLKGVRKYVLLTISPFYNDNGYLIGSFILFRDITDRRKIEEKLLKSELSLQETVATKDKFFSIIAHDLKNPFGSIMGFSELILRKLQTSNIEKIGHYAQIIHSASQHGFQLLENLLAWSRSQNGTLNYIPSKVSINEILKHNIEVIGESAEQKNISINVSKTEGFYVYVDEDMANTIIRNLLSNAIKFSNNNSEIAISASKVDTQMAKVVITDQGIGIRKPHLDKLFSIDSNKSTRGTSGEEGTGLGLILCKEFVEKNKGEIWAESSPGRGSTFSFTMPLAN